MYAELSQKDKKLQNLLEREKVWSWSTKHQSAVRLVQENLREVINSTYFSRTYKLQVKCDAGGYRLTLFLQEKWRGGYY